MSRKKTKWSGRRMIAVEKPKHKTVTLSLATKLPSGGVYNEGFFDFEANSPEGFEEAKELGKQIAERWNLGEAMDKIEGKL